MNRSVLINVGKFAFAGGILYYLIAKGTLDFRQFAVFLNRPDFLLTFLGVWVLGSVVLGSLRWQTLLVGVDVKVGLKLACKLQMIGFFFNVAMPGLVGGDLVKALYVMRDSEKAKRAGIMVSVVIDRICGLASMFVLAAVILLLNIRSILDFKEGSVLVLLVLCCVAGMTLFFAAVFLPYSEERDPFRRVLRLKIPGFSLPLRLYDSLRMYRNHPMAIVRAILYGCIIQLSIMGLYYYLFLLLTPDQSVSFAGVAMAYPLGSLVASLPISPGGLGVGHVAYDRLFGIVGIKGGANAFNIFILTHMVFNLLGCIPFLMYKAQGKALSTSEIEKASEEAI